MIGSHFTYPHVFLVKFVSARPILWTFTCIHTYCVCGARGGAVGWGTAPEGGGFNSRWCHWLLSLT